MIGHMEETIGGNASREKGERPNIPLVKPTTPLRRIPWKTIALVLAGAAIVAWTVGFIAGLIVRFGFYA
jgi:hypothetical protein